MILYILAGRLLAQSFCCQKEKTTTISTARYCVHAGTVAEGELDVVLVRRLRVGGRRRLVAVSRIVHGGNRIVARADSGSFHDAKVEEGSGNPHGLCKNPTTHIMNG